MKNRWMKLLALLGTVVFITGISSMATFAAGASEFHYESFEGIESGLDGWTESLPTASISNETSFHGSSSLKLTTDGQVLVNRHLTELVAGERYIFSAYCKINGSCSGVEMSVKNGVWDSVSANLAGIVGITTTNNKWAKYQFSWTPSETITGAYLVLKAYSGTAYFDYLSFCMSDSLMSNGDFEEFSEITTINNHNMDWPFSWKYDSTLDMYDGTINSVDYKAKVGLTNEGAHSGTYSLKQETDSNGYNRRIYQSISGLTGGKTYELSAWVKVIGTGASANGAVLYAMESQYISTGATYAGGRYNSTVEVIKTTDNKWKKTTTYVTLPENKTGFTICLTFDRGGVDTNPGYYALWDDIQLTECKTKIEFFDDDGQQLSDISKIGNIAAKLTYYNSSADPDDYSFIVALYKNQNGVKLLQDIKLIPGNVNAGSVTTQLSDAIYIGSVEDDYSVEALLWDSLDKVNPQIKKASVSTN